MGAVNDIWDAVVKAVPQLKRSNATIESKIVDVVGTYADTERLEVANTLTTINEALASQKITTVEYYRRKAVAFQKDDTLVYDSINQGGYYDPINPQNQIIKQAYVVGAYPDFTLLINALDSAGHLRKLTPEELASFITYFEAFQPMALVMNIMSMDVAKISDPGITIYIRTGVNAGEVARKINEALIAHEAIFRKANVVSLTEIEDTIQQTQGVVAIGFSAPIATEIGLDGQERTVSPVRGIFPLTNGAFTFTTEITVNNIKTLQ